MRAVIFHVPTFCVPFAFAILTACSPYSPDLGSSPFLCGPATQTPRCPDGYTCQMVGTSGEYCLSSGGTVPVDGRPSNCADDSQLEPNDTIQTAFQTPVATQKKNLTFAGLAICPAGDKDNYSVTITAQGQNLEVLIEPDAGGADLQGAIVGMSGSALMMASPATGMPGVKRAYVPNMPQGVYYAQVYGPANGSLQTNNYKLTINVTGP